jgi:signal transduction histidine kinase
VIFRIPLAAAAVVLLAAGLLFDLVHNRFSAPLLAFGVHPQVVGQLERSLADQRELAGRDPEHAALYRERFAALETLVQRLYVLELNRAGIARRYQQIVLAVFAALAVAVAAAYVWRQGRRETRLLRVQAALAELAAGRTDVTLRDRGRDAVGRIAGMIEQTSRRMSRDRRRLAALRNLSAWQEAARRHAHEMRTPLTGARLELGRLAGLLESESLKNPAEIRQAAASAGQEIERLGTFAQQFTSFARLPHPEKKTWDLGRLLAEFASTFAAAWPNLTLACAPPDAPIEVLADRDMVRQVLVNLCDNSSLALGDRKGRVELAADVEGEAAVVRVADDGPGVAEEVRPRLFEPYTTTRKIGHGMGLGLAISKKIALDHDGDLELERTSEEGTVFRLTLPKIPPGPPFIKGGERTEEDDA